MVGRCDGDAAEEGAEENADGFGHVMKGRREGGDGWMDGWMDGWVLLYGVEREGGGEVVKW